MCINPINRYIIPKRVVGLVSDCIRFLRLKLRYAGKINASKIIKNENSGKSVSSLKRINLIIKNKMLLDLLIILTYRLIENL